MVMKGKRRKGRPKRRWMDSIKDFLTKEGLLGRGTGPSCLEATHQSHQHQKKKKNMLQSILEQTTKAQSSTNVAVNITILADSVDRRLLICLYAHSTSHSASTYHNASTYRLRSATSMTRSERAYLCRVKRVTPT